MFVLPVQVDGRFAFDAPAGSYTLRFCIHDNGASHDVTRASPISVHSGETSSAITRLAPRRLRMVVVDAKTGRPAPGVVLSIDQHRAGSYGRLTTDAAGVAVLYPCPVGEFGVSIKDDISQGWQASWSNVARVSAELQEEVVIRIAR